MQLLSKLRFFSLKFTITDLGYPVLALLFIAPKYFYIIWFSIISILNVPDESYYRNASCALNFISTGVFFVFFFVLLV